MRLSFRFLLASGAAVAVLAGAPQAFAASEALFIITFTGNPTCSSIINDPGVLELKVDKPNGGWPALSEHSANGLTISLEMLENGRRANWTATAGGPVNAVIIKSGNGGKIYVFPDEGAFQDTDEVGITNPSGTSLLEISHIQWCHGLSEPEFVYEPCPVVEGDVPLGHILFGFDTNRDDLGLSVCTNPAEPVVFCDRRPDAPPETACLPPGTVLKRLPIVIEALCTVTDAEVEGCSTFCTTDLSGRTVCKTK